MHKDKLHIPSLTSVIAMLVMVMMACTRHTPNPRLVAINRTIEENPHTALTELVEMNPDSLDSDSRHFRNLLIIKASDKAYITHTSDSLILDVMDYYEAHREDPFYPEALYYGGRVYSDLGDFPTALDFFRKAADNLLDSAANLKFRAKILSQTGHILNRLRLYDEAELYLKKVVDIDRKLNDTTNLPFDITSQVSNHIHNNNFSLAENLIVETLKHDSLPEKDKRNLWVYLAVTKYKTGKIAEALRIIQNEGKALNDNEECDVLAYRVQIYYRAGMLDSAYVMAKRLIKYPEYLNKRIGYRILISPEMRSRIPSDSLNIYIDEYSDGMEIYLDENGNKAALMQQASYNYSKHAKREKEISRINSSLTKWAFSLTLLLLLSITLFIFLLNSYRRKKRFLQQELEDLSNHKNKEIASLQQRLTDLSNHKDEEVAALNSRIVELSNNKNEEIAALHRQIVELSNNKNEEIVVLQQKIVELSERKNQNVPNIEDAEKISSPILDNSDEIGNFPTSSANTVPSINELRSEVMEKLKTFIDNNKDLPAIPLEILHSDIYSYIQTRLNIKRPIPDDNDIWEKIQNMVTTTSPEFVKMLNKLSGGTLSPLEFQTVVLIRIGMQPQQLVVLMNRGKGAIVSRRKSISKKMLGVEISTQDLDLLIRIL